MILHDRAVMIAGSAIERIGDRKVNPAELWLVYGFAVAIVGIHAFQTNILKEQQEYSVFVVDEAQWFLGSIEATNDIDEFEEMVKSCCNLMFPLDVAVAKMLDAKPSDSFNEIFPLVAGGFGGLLPASKRALADSEITHLLVKMWAGFIDQQYGS